MTTFARTPKRFIIAALFALFFMGSSEAGPAFTLSLLPGASIQGNPGDTIGWGYSITNNSADYLLATNLGAGLFTSGMTPLVIFDFPEVAPNSTVTLDFSTVVTGTCSAPPCGIYEVALSSSIAPATTVTGLFDVTAELYNGDPFNGGTDLMASVDLTASYSAAASTPFTGVPEPAPFAEILGALAALIAWKARKFKRNGNPPSCSERIDHRS
jgi:hypothetical protein